MGYRYEYEAPGLLKFLGMRLLDRLSGDTTQLVWILDKRTGSRIPVDDFGDSLVSVLSDALTRYDSLAKETRDDITDKTFDEVASALFERAQGDTRRCEELAEWSMDDWQRWCDDYLSRSKV